jgi:hypothetical protein
VVVELARGHVDCEVAPRAGKAPFVVRAGDVNVRVVGTRFGVTREAADVIVDVVRGAVEVESAGDRSRVTEGQRWPPAAPRIEVTGSTAAGHDVAPASSASSSKLGMSSDPAGLSTPRVPAHPHPSARPSAVDPGPNPGTTVLNGGSKSTGSLGDPPSRQSRYEDAVALESTAPNRAVAAYLDLARGSDGWAANALFAAGRLEAERRLNHEAEQLLEQYLTRFPRGANAADARDLLERLSRVHAP